MAPVQHRITVGRRTGTDPIVDCKAEAVAEARLYTLDHGIDTGVALAALMRIEVIT